jgi:hypothetical protein
MEAGSASVTEVPVRLGKDSVRLVDLNVIPPDPAHLHVFVSVAQAAQAVAGSHTDSRLVARLLLGRGELVEARVWAAVDKGVDGAVLGEQLLRAVVRGRVVGAEVGVSDWDGAVVVLLIHGSSDVLALNIRRCPHAAQRKEDGDKGFDKGAELRATDRVIVEDSEDYCGSRSVLDPIKVKRNNQGAYQES